MTKNSPSGQIVTDSDSEPRPLGSGCGIPRENDRFRSLPALTVAAPTKIRSRRIVPASSPGMAAADSAGALPRALNRAVLRHRLNEVLAATRLEAANLGQQRSNRDLVNADGDDERRRGRRTDQADQHPYESSHGFSSDEWKSRRFFLSSRLTTWATRLRNEFWTCSRVGSLFDRGIRTRSRPAGS